MYLKDTTSLPKLIVTIPVMNEEGYIESCLESIRKQSFTNYHIIACVNQPDHWWNDPEKRVVCENNERTLSFLKNLENPYVEVIDKSSPGKGFLPGDKGVGHARNILFQRAINIADDNDLVMSLDADTVFNEGYFQSIVDLFQNNYDIVAHSNPYYHNPAENEDINRAILRYEIYMRLYVLNLWRINSPYAFTPLGSAITAYVKSLKTIGKLSPKLAGEDFYLLQKLRKHGRISQYNEYYVYPSSRISKRVPFGTGPAVADGINKKWENYPIYPVEPFNIIKETYELFPVLFEEDVQTPMDGFFEKIFETKYIFQPLRSNYKTKDQFIRACHTKIDALRIFQFVKDYHKKHPNPDEINLHEHLYLFFNEKEKSKIKSFFSTFKFEDISIPLLQNLRDLLTEKEMEYRKKDFYEPQLPF